MAGFSKQINVSPPSFKNNNQWELTSLGFVGFIPFSESLSFYLEPKVPLKNFFGMWEYAYKLRIFENYSDLYQSKSLQEFYEQLANVLAKQIFNRGRKGFCQDIYSREERLSVIRGKLDLRKNVNKPWEPCIHIANFRRIQQMLKKNQILAWTLYSILRSGFCSERVLPFIRNSYRKISSIVSIQPFSGNNCRIEFIIVLIRITSPFMHSVSFFWTIPVRHMKLVIKLCLPFLVNMWELFELFVAEWVKKLICPEKYSLVPSGNGIYRKVWRNQSKN